MLQAADIHKFSSYIGVYYRQFDATPGHLASLIVVPNTAAVAVQIPMDFLVVALQRIANLYNHQHAARYPRTYEYPDPYVA